MPAPSKLNIATSSLQRLVKEESSYHKELEQQHARLKKTELDQADENAEYMVKQQVRRRQARPGRQIVSLAADRPSSGKRLQRRNPSYRR